MKTRISAIVGFLCVLGVPLSASAGSELPTISSGTLEPYISVLAGIAVPRSHDATFTDGTTPTVVKDIDYQTVGGNAGIWFPTRNKLWGFDLGLEITGFIWYADVACCVDNFNRFAPGPGVSGFGPDASGGNTTEISGIYVGPNFLVRYPMAISEAYPNGRWHPYVGIGVGAHQMAMRPGGQTATGFLRAITEERDTTVGMLAVGGVKAHIFKYVSLFAEAKYIRAQHDGLTTDRFSQSGGAFTGALFSGNLVVNRYESTIDTILAHAGMSIHFDIRP
ncbi:MAG: hypothetical protein HP497_12865 [Nitrospira sp.]|nr:hypothetical protein [Nitrospira sp.]